MQTSDHRRGTAFQSLPHFFLPPAAEADLATGHSGINWAPQLTFAGDDLIVEHLSLVRVIARRIHERLPKHVLIEDLFSAGVVGLMDASRKFDSSKDAKFSTYAQCRIRGTILDYLRSLDWAPRGLRLKGRAVEEAIQRLTVSLGRAPHEAEIAHQLGSTLADYLSLLGELKGLEIGSLNNQRWEGSDEEELAYLPSSPEDDPLSRCIAGEMRRRLVDAIGALPERERLVLTLYYYEEFTMKEIADVLSVAASRASQLHASAVLHLRSKMARQGPLARQKSSQSKVTALPSRLDPREKSTISYSLGVEC